MKEELAKFELVNVSKLARDALRDALAKATQAPWTRRTIGCEAQIQGNDGDAGRPRMLLTSGSTWNKGDENADAAALMRNLIDDLLMAADAADELCAALQPKIVTVQLPDAVVVAKPT